MGDQSWSENEDRFSMIREKIESYAVAMEYLIYYKLGFTSLGIILCCFGLRTHKRKRSAMY